MDVTQKIANELAVSPQQVNAAISLLDEGATVPFIARYRKEITGGLDDIQLRLLDERLLYLRELNSRRETVLKNIADLNKLTPTLEQTIKQAETKTLLEDLYLPYKTKRRTKAQIAREAGLQLLADTLFNDRTANPEQLASNYLNKEHKIDNVQAALDGARHIIMEQIAEDAPLLTNLRERIWQNGLIKVTVAKDKEHDAQKFKDYFDYQEAIAKIPSHRALALLRGRHESLLSIQLLAGKDDKAEHQLCTQLVARHINITDTTKAADAWLADTARLAWKVKLFTRIDLDLKQRLREAAETEAINVFALNLKDLLLAAPAGEKVTLGLDPGIRTGVKVAIVDKTGKLLTTETIYPHAPRNQWHESIATLAKLIKKYHVELVSIGNGTGSRETDQLVADILKQQSDLKFHKIMVSEAGASVYSASELASKEFPELDVSLRGAVSIARRLQDPLAELVKIEAKAIGVGQYQHDVNQVQLARSLDAVVEDCVNAVGVDVNTASVPLLNQVSGITKSISQNIINYRDEQGAFTNRKQLKKVARLGEKAFEQAAGFLRIRNGDNPLDNSSVHPEAYPLVEAIVQKTKLSIRDLAGKAHSLNPNDYINDSFGLPTVNDILIELDKPNHDPRPEFKSVRFKAGVEKITDLVEGMQLEGVVTNVANFGAFVDIGVHQDGLVHISQLADKFVKDPRDVVKTGQMVSVKVVEIDVARKRIALSMKKQADEVSKVKATKPAKNPTIKTAPAMENAFAKALKR